MNAQNYGFQFNDFSLNKDKTVLIKKAKNEYGKKKIETEIKFYKFILNNNIPLNIPTISKLTDHSIEMEYLQNYKPLQEIFYELPHQKQKKIYQNILSNISVLHTHKEQLIDPREYEALIKEEVYTKIVNRISKVKKVLDKHKYTTVNNTKVGHIEKYCEQIYTYLTDNIKHQRHTLCPIHGDIHLGNVLIEPTTCNIKFIDPRGYFGTRQIYGMKEYDYAKLLFGTVGYSVFDTMVIDNLDTSASNINIPFIKKFEPYLSFNTNKYVKYLMLSIWLGNCSSFTNENKIVTSYYVALYLCSKYL